MQVLAAIVGLATIVVILIDAFESIILPRRATRRFRLARLLTRVCWRAWSGVARRLPGDRDREGVTLVDRALGIFGPLMLLLLVAVWASALVVGFALLTWGLDAAGTQDHAVSFGASLYLSGTTFFTLGIGDVVPTTTAGRVVTVLEAGMVFSFLALLIGYVPPIISRFAERETEITLLDARAGSPPSAVELLCRLGGPGARATLDRYLLDWERWAAVLLESHLSYPLLSFFRSQHERQSWLSALTVTLDTCALVLVGVADDAGPFPTEQARLTFAMARHAVGDLAQVLGAAPQLGVAPRLSVAELARAHDMLTTSGIHLRSGEGAVQQLAALRALYEPYVLALSGLVRMSLPSWLPDNATPDDWETTAWQWDRDDVAAALERERWA